MSLEVVVGLVTVAVIAGLLVWKSFASHNKQIVTAVENTAVVAAVDVGYVVGAVDTAVTEVAAVANTVVTTGNVSL